MSTHPRPQLHVCGGQSRKSPEWQGRWGQSSHPGIQMVSHPEPSPGVREEQSLLLPTTRLALRESQLPGLGPRLATEPGATRARLQEGSWGTRKPCRAPEPPTQKGVKRERADAGWKRDFTSPMC